MAVDPLIVTVSIILLVAIILVVISGVRIIQPYEQGLLVVLGRYRRRLNPGFNLVLPLISQVVRLDLRTQVLDVPRQEVITRDNSPTQVDAVIYIRIIDPEKAYFQVANYRLAVLALAQTTLRSVIGDMELDEILYQRDKINTRLRDILDTATDNWGVRIEAVEIREVDPIGTVKAAMEEQTSAERKRRAAILTADGEKRSKILVAEGDKRSRILQAEGVRQAKILEAEGTRLQKVLEAQGEAQGLRIISLGAATLDGKSLTVLSLEAVKELGKGQATKIVLPFELTRVTEGISKYFGQAAKTEERSANSLPDLEKLIGKSEDILGSVPTAKQLREEISTIEEEMKSEASMASDEISTLVEHGKGEGAAAQAKAAKAKKA
ncbi:MAG TPA: SPFH domain-containing protein [Candidatus Thermoplasmatota archaeon]|nr:SPFH domain-containing protein [Candidatus Thermoplasmatota archaeon]